MQILSQSLILYHNCVLWYVHVLYSPYVTTSEIRIETRVYSSRCMRRRRRPWPSPAVVRSVRELVLRVASGWSDGPTVARKQGGVGGGVHAGGDALRAPAGGVEAAPFVAQPAPVRRRVRRTSACCAATRLAARGVRAARRLARVAALAAHSAARGLGGAARLRGQARYRSR